MGTAVTTTFVMNECTHIAETDNALTVFILKSSYIHNLTYLKGKEVSRQWQPYFPVFTKNSSMTSERLLGPIVGTVVTATFVIRIP